MVIWEVVLDVKEFFLESDVLVLDNLVDSSFIIGHGAVLGKMVLCIILGLILILLRVGF